MALKLHELNECKNGSKTCEAELAEILKQYTDLYADYGKCRQREVIKKI